jgi:hypothetical protein
MFAALKGDVRERPFPPLRRDAYANVVDETRAQRRHRFALEVKQGASS